MFKFLKNLFTEKKKIEIESVKLDDLNNWFQNKAKLANDSLNLQINSIIERLKQETNDTKENLKLLKEATLKNPNIPQKAIHMMEGNREAYIKKVKNLPSLSSTGLYI